MTGGHLNCRDVMSPYCRKLKGIAVERLDKYDETEECWQEILIPDQTCTPAELAACRIDFPAWLEDAQASLTASSPGSLVSATGPAMPPKSLA